LVLHLGICPEWATQISHAQALGNILNPI
jgi:hypothetical protein